MTEIKLIIAAVVLVIVGLMAWGVKHAVDTFQATAAENAALKIEAAELKTSLRESERTTGIVFQAALGNRETKNAINAVTGTIQEQLRQLALSDPALRDRASRPVPLPVQQRLRKRITDSDGYPAMQGVGSIPGSDAGTSSKQPDGGQQGRDTRGTSGSPARVQR